MAGSLKDTLNPEKGLIFRITHRDNVPWILDNGLHCKNANVTDPNFVVIGNPDLIDRRSRHVVTHPPYGFLSDYVPFYFTPLSPMFYNIKTGWKGIRQRDNAEIVIMVSSLHKLIERQLRFLFTDRHAVLAAAQYFDDLSNLDQLNWIGLQNRDFSRDPENPTKVEKYEAETLVYRFLPIDALLGIACYDDSVTADVSDQISRRRLTVKAATHRGFYF